MTTPLQPAQAKRQKDEKKKRQRDKKMKRQKDKKATLLQLAPVHQKHYHHRVVEYQIYHTEKTETP